MYLKNNSQFSTLNSQFIVDTGISTYEVGKTRNYERSTKAHNTVEINNTNSSEVWGGFRVANRAKVIEIEENENYIKATHNGYEKKFGVLHTREWIFKENKIIIKDILNKEAKAIFRLHFGENVKNEDILDKILFQNRYKIKDSYISKEYNKNKSIKVLEIYFEKELEVEINI